MTTYIETFEIEFHNGSEWEWYEIGDNPIPENLEDVTYCIVETEYPELNEVLKFVLDFYLFNNTPNIETLINLKDGIEKMDKEEVMKTLAYHAEYIITSIDELLSFDRESIKVIDGYDCSEDYLKDISLSNESIDINLARFVDWEGYAGSIGWDFQSLELDNETFLYTVG